jgi:hypothetical protein
MVFWIFIFPASLYLGIPSTLGSIVNGVANSHLNRVVERFDILQPPVPTETITKYLNRTSIVFLHQLPAGIWSLLVPIQLLGGYRNSSSNSSGVPRRVHRYLGYIFFAMVPLITLGLAMILGQGLTFEGDYSRETIYSASTNASPLLLLAVKLLNTLLAILGIYFLATGLTAMWFIVRQQQRNIRKHKIWIYRHVAAGLWVALQRVYLLWRRGETKEEQFWAFYTGGVVGVILAIGMTEIYIRWYLNIDNKNESDHNNHLHHNQN